MYLFLADETCHEIRRERVHALEADHYRNVLVLTELEGVLPARRRCDELRVEQAELERRITLHQAHLGMVSAREALDAEGEQRAVAGSDDAAGRRTVP